MKKLLDNLEFIPMTVIIAAWVCFSMELMLAAFCLLGFVLVFSVLMLINSIKG